MIWAECLRNLHGAKNILLNTNSRPYVTVHDVHSRFSFDLDIHCLGTCTHEVQMCSQDLLIQIVLPF